MHQYVKAMISEFILFYNLLFFKHSNHKARHLKPFSLLCHATVHWLCITDEEVLGYEEIFDSSDDVKTSDPPRELTTYAIMFLTGIFLLIFLP